MKKKILVIEDNALIRDNIEEILELANYDVLGAENGKEGVSLARQSLPDLVLCDIMMPELDGYGVLFLLGKIPETSAIPLIFLTAKTEKSEIRKGMALGADDYITKPFKEMDLLDAIEGRLKRCDALKQNFSNDSAGLESFIKEVEDIPELKSLSKSRKSRTYKKKVAIYREEDTPTALYLLNKGKVKLVKVHEDGKEYITSWVKEGEYFGYLPIMEDRLYSEMAVTAEDSEVYRIPKEDFVKLLRSNREVSKKFIKMISNNLTEKEELLLSLAYDTVRKKVANALTSLKTRFQKEETGKFSIEISRGDLANMVGTATESVIRTLSDFKEEGLIEINGKEIVVKDEAKLNHIW